MLVIIRFLLLLSFLLSFLNRNRLLPQKFRQKQGGLNIRDTFGKREIFQCNLANVETPQVSAATHILFDGSKSPKVHEPFGKSARECGIAQSSLRRNRRGQCARRRKTELFLQVLTRARKRMFESMRDGQDHSCRSIEFFVIL